LSGSAEACVVTAWQPAFSGLELWCVDLRAAGSSLAVIEQETPRLSHWEQDHAATMKDAAAATEWLAAHVALRVLIERAAGPGWRRRAFERGRATKPRLDEAPVDFSLSHVPGRALVGLSREGAIGVDLERARVVNMNPARRHPLEAAAAALNPDGPLPIGEDARFLQCWVRLEALAKATGWGVGALLTRLALTAGAHKGDNSGPATRIVELRASLPPFLVWDLDLGEHLFGAAVTPAGWPQPVILAFPNRPKQIQGLMS